ncbi:MAG: aminotransferase class V-fold PLP-dependent enzyme [Armatimonadetes bacterium]|nr:aminotransferase class V-fold PLP-dependent enzyme [Armatimonadota bacterium]
MKRENYFDHAATSPLDPRVLEAMLPWLGEDFGNASSLHPWGDKARFVVEQARERVAMACGVAPEQVFFCSGGTEACNLAVRLLASRGSFGVSPFEHSAVRESAARHGGMVLENRGWDVLVPPGVGVAMMGVCNETGGIPALKTVGAPIPSGSGRMSLALTSGEMATLHPGLRNDGVGDPDPEGIGAPTATESQALRFLDATQSFAKTHDDDWETADLIALSAHKFGGPQGVGAFILRDPAQFKLPEDAANDGGYQETFFSGTTPVPLVVGMGIAAEIARDEEDENFAHAAELRDVLLEAISKIPDARDNNAPEQSPFILSITIPGLVAHALVIELGTRGFGTSSGAACSSRSTAPSPVLTALGLSEADALATIRVSFASSNTKESTLALANALKESAERLRS